MLFLYITVHMLFLYIAVHMLFLYIAVHMLFFYVHPCTGTEALYRPYGL